MDERVVGVLFTGWLFGFLDVVYCRIGRAFLVDVTFKHDFLGWLFVHCGWVLNNGRLWGFLLGVSLRRLLFSIVRFRFNLLELLLLGLNLLGFLLLWLLFLGFLLLWFDLLWFLLLGLNLLRLFLLWFDLFWLWFNLLRFRRLGISGRSDGCLFFRFD